jgi:hypothetical protein
MADAGSALSSAVQGGLAGSQFGSVLGIPGWAIGGGIGLISGLFSDSPEELAKQRWESFKKSLQEMKTNSLRSGSQLIGSQTAASKADATIAGKRQAISSGRANQAQSFILPGVGQAGTTGANALNQFTENTNQRFDNALIQGELAMAERPLPTQPSEYFDVAANAAGQFGANQKRYKMLEDAISSQNEFNTQQQKNQDKWNTMFLGGRGNTVENTPITDNYDITQDSSGLWGLSPKNNFSLDIPKAPQYSSNWYKPRLY